LSHDFIWMDQNHKWEEGDKREGGRERWETEDCWLICHQIKVWTHLDSLWSVSTCLLSLPPSLGCRTHPQGRGNQRAIPGGQCCGEAPSLDLAFPYWGHTIITEQLNTSWRSWDGMLWTALWKNLPTQFLALHL